MTVADEFEMYVANFDDMPERQRPPAHPARLDGHAVVIKITLENGDLCLHATRICGATYQQSASGNFRNLRLGLAEPMSCREFVVDRLVYIGEKWIAGCEHPTTEPHICEVDFMC